MKAVGGNRRFSASQRRAFLQIGKVSLNKPKKIEVDRSMSMRGDETYPMTTLNFGSVAVASLPTSPFRPPALRNSVLFRPLYFDEFNAVLEIKALIAHCHTRCFLAYRRIET
jgi:hypothetical protein